MERNEKVVLEKYFLTSRATNIQKEIYGLR
jgi:hypothetical protein